MSSDRTRPDACPGAVSVHQAADGGLARIRVPGGTMTRAQFAAIHEAAVQLGDGRLELTSRANIQIRGLAAGAERELAQRLTSAGLLPSRTHERVRNIIASPLADTQALVDELDNALCGVAHLAGLPGRFLVTVDGGDGDVSGLGADVGVQRTGDSWAVLLAGQDTGVRVEQEAVTQVVVRAADAFLEVRGNAWRVSELGDEVAKIIPRLGVPTGDRVAIRPSTPLRPGRQADVLVVDAPLGRLGPAQAQALLDPGSSLRLTPWRSLVVPDHTAADRLAEVGLITDPSSAWHGVTACTGRPGCAKALADVQADATRWLRSADRTGTLPVHWSGCGRRCGRPAGRVVDVIATTSGYEVRSEQ